MGARPEAMVFAGRRCSEAWARLPTIVGSDRPCPAASSSQTMNAHLAGLRDLERSPTTRADLSGRGGPLPSHCSPPSWSHPRPPKEVTTSHDPKGCGMTCRRPTRLGIVRPLCTLCAEENPQHIQMKQASRNCRIMDKGNKGDSEIVSHVPRRRKTEVDIDYGHCSPVNLLPPLYLGPSPQTPPPRVHFVPLRCIAAGRALSITISQPLVHSFTPFLLLLYTPTHRRPHLSGGIVFAFACAY